MKRVAPHNALRRAQSGAALIVLTVVLVLGTSALLLSALNVASSQTETARRTESGRALAEAKLALLGYVATKAATDTYPGRLPCPEAAGYYGDPANEGIASGYCTLPAVGRLPWRTLGLSKLTDGYGEPLWYVVSPGFALPSSGASVSINSNTLAQLTLDGTGAAAVALIIAPGPPISVQTTTGCTARVQSRSSSPPDLRDYLECENASTEVSSPYRFATTGPSASFNDQVVKVTHAELFDAIEPVVAKRIETEIAPVLKTVYAGTDWNLSGTNIYPFAVSFTDPADSALTFLGNNDQNEGLLPMFRLANDPTRIVWYAGSSDNRPTVSEVGTSGVSSWSCSSGASTSSTVSCTVTYTGSVRIKVTAWARRVFRSMRQLNLASVPLSWADPVDPNPKLTVDATPSSTTADAYVYVEANLPNAASPTTKTVTFPIAVLADHPLTDPNHATLGWFVKNNWHHLVYYAFAPNYAADQTLYCNDDPPPPSSNSYSNDCLTVYTVNDPTPRPDGKVRAILILMGRAVTTKGLPSGAVRTQVRSSSSNRDNLLNYIEDAENRDGNKLFVRNALSRTSNNAFNDRIIVVDSNPIYP